MNDKTEELVAKFSLKQRQQILQKLREQKKICSQCGQRKSIA
jgi:hypothetical protein